MLNDHITEQNQTLGRAEIISALYAFIKQKPGLEYGNYENPKSYRAEMRGITRDLNHARFLIRKVELSSITGDALARAFRHAFGGRLSWDGARLDYCTGQYWPTEYRLAVCSVCSYALWDHCRDALPKGAGRQLRAMFRKEYGRAIGSRWFN
jgi:hypothetical protein